MGPASAIVALRPSTGAVLAAASGPGSNGYNTAMLGQYAPGSIFKMVDSLAMLRNGLTPDSKVECTPTLTVDGRTFKNAEGYPEGSLGLGDPPRRLRPLLQHGLHRRPGQRVTQAQLEAAATSLGVAVEAPSLGADAFLGSVPGEAEGTEHAASMIGQGKVLMSPLAAAIMAGSVAKGAPVSPQLVLNPDAGAAAGRHRRRADGGRLRRRRRPLRAEAPPRRPDKPITTAEAAALADMMRAVVTSGHAGFLAERAGRTRGGQDRNGGVRQREPAQDARLDRGRPRRPGRGRFR